MWRERVCVCVRACVRVYVAACVVVCLYTCIIRTSAAKASLNTHSSRFS